jgi:hypothetical protein
MYPFVPHQHPQLLRVVLQHERVVDVSLHSMLRSLLVRMTRQFWHILGHATLWTQFQKKLL